MRQSKKLAYASFESDFIKAKEDQVIQISSSQFSIIFVDDAVAYF